jgi:hypothetical protein
LNHLSTYTFHEGSWPSTFEIDFEPALFNLQEFAALTKQAQLRTYYACHEGRQKVVAFVHFQIDKDSALSPFRAPFGSIEAVQDIDPHTLYDFIAFIERHLRALAVRRVILKNPPRAYSPTLLALLETFLLNHGFTVANAEPGAVIRVTNEDFSTKIDHAQRLRKKQAESAGLRFCLMQRERLDDIYRSIEAWHAEKGYQVPLSLELLHSAVQRFPDRYILSAVVKDDEICAAAISVRVSENVLYNFLVNHDPGLNSLSPPVQLMEGLYRYCVERGIGLFDLGTSALAGKPNFPLLEFKLRMGAAVTSKLTFYKDLS